MGNERYNLMADNVISNDGHMKAAQLATKLAEANGKRFAAEDRLDALVSLIDALVLGRTTVDAMELIRLTGEYR
jgi:hypothetical protein